MEWTTVTRYDDGDSYGIRRHGGSMPGRRQKSRVRQYDVCLSFAGEDRGYVAKVAAHLQSRGMRTFYDEYERVSLWGKDLYEHLDDVYRNAARYCVLFISRFYAKRLWTSHERKSAQARAFNENREYILPARFDTTPLPGLLPTVGYIDLKNLRPKELSDLIVDKVGFPRREYYVPPIPDRLFARLNLEERGPEAMPSSRPRNLWKRSSACPEVEWRPQWYFMEIVRQRRTKEGASHTE